MKTLFILAVSFLLFTSSFPQNYYAVLIVGVEVEYPDKSGGGPILDLENACWNDMFTMWKLLNDNGYSNENIFVLYGNGNDIQVINSDYNPNYLPTDEDVTDFSATKSNVENVFNSLASTLTSEDVLFIFTFGHGRSTGNCNSSLELMNGELMTDDEFAALVNNISYSKRIIKMAQCYSGGFYDELVDPNYPNTIFIAATQCNQMSTYSDDLLPDGTDPLENEIYEGNHYTHEESNYHFLNALRRSTIYYDDDSFVSSVDNNNDGLTSIKEAWDWTAYKHSRTITYTPSFYDPNNIAELTFLNTSIDQEWRLILSSENNNNPYLRWEENNDVGISVIKYNIYRSVRNNTVPLPPPNYIKIDEVNNDVFYYIDDQYALGGPFILNYRITASYYPAKGGSMLETPPTNEVETHGGLYKNKIQKSDKVNSFILSQNYPNPFNPSTAIDYQIPEDGLVSLKIYDILGNEVKTLVNDYKTVGKYQLNFNADGMSSGVYIYKIQVNDFVSSKKMMLVR